MFSHQSKTAGSVCKTDKTNIKRVPEYYDVTPVQHTASQIK